MINQIIFSICIVYIILVILVDYTQGKKTDQFFNK
jgi:hypothetical protein